jgi:hypothetical protein
MPLKCNATIHTLVKSAKHAFNELHITQKLELDDKDTIDLIREKTWMQFSGIFPLHKQKRRLPLISPQWCTFASFSH